MEGTKKSNDSPDPAPSGRVPSVEDLPPDFRPVVLGEPRRAPAGNPPESPAVSSSRAERHKAKRPAKTVHFEAPDEVQLARLIDVKRALEGGSMNALLIRLLRRGFNAEVAGDPDWPIK